MLAARDVTYRKGGKTQASTDINRRIYNVSIASSIGQPSRLESGVLELRWLTGRKRTGLLLDDKFGASAVGRRRLNCPRRPPEESPLCEIKGLARTGV